MLNELYLDLQNEGITDINIIGINGYQYIDDNYQSMISGKVLPWVQDIPEFDVWGDWDITSRDFVILDRYGNEFARVNLTPMNPDPEYTCGINFERLRELIIAARNR